MTLDENSFEALADKTLADLLGAIEDQLGDVADVDMQGGVLTIELDAGGEYVVNKHAPMRQVWVSSPVSGATHFAYDADGRRWVSTRHAATTLDALLAEELAAATGRPFSLD